MKFSIILGAVGTAAMLVGGQSFALTITPAGTDPGNLGLIGTTDINSNCEPDCIPGADATWDLLYKADASGGGEEGFLTGSYETTYSNPSNDPQDALIEWVLGTPSLNCTAAGQCILVVKDGNHSPAQYFFDLFLAGWNGTDDLFLDGFWPQQGAISHVSIWGPDADTCCEQDVPEPGTLALLGFGLMGLGLSRRRFVAK